MAANAANKAKEAASNVNLSNVATQVWRLHSLSRRRLLGCAPTACHASMAAEICRRQLPPDGWRTENVATSQLQAKAAASTAQVKAKAAVEKVRAQAAAADGMHAPRVHGQRACTSCQAHSAAAVRPSCRNASWRVYFKGGDWGCRGDPQGRCRPRECRRGAQRRNCRGNREITDSLAGAPEACAGPSARISLSSSPPPAAASVRTAFSPHSAGAGLCPVLCCVISS